MRTTSRCLLAAALWAAVVLPAAAQPPKAKYLEKDTFFQMESVSSPQISPDGSQIVFSRGFVDIPKDQNASNLWVIDVKGERLRQLTEGTWRDSAPTWSPDGKRIAFLSDRSGSTQIHVMWADTRETAQLTRTERAPGGLKWSPDGKLLLFTVGLPDETPVLQVKLPSTPRGAQLARGAVIVDRLSWGSDGVGPTTKQFTQVFTVDALVGGTPRQVTSGSYNHGAPEWSSDGKTIYVSGIRKPDAEYLRNDSEIYAVDLATLNVTPLTDRKGPDSNPVVSPDGKWIAYTGSDDKNETSALSSLYLMDAGGGAKRLWAGGLPSSPGDVEWAPDGSGVYYAMEENGESNEYFVAVAPGSAPKKVTSGAHMLTGAVVRAHGTGGGHPVGHDTAPRAGDLCRLQAVRDEDARGRERRRAAGRDAGQRRTTVVRVERRPEGAGLADEARELRPREEIPDGALDSRRAVEHVQRRLELGVPELGRQRLRGAVDEPAWLHRLRAGVRERHPVLVSRQGLRRPDGRRGRGPGEGLDRQGQPVRVRRVGRRPAHRVDRRPHRPVPRRGVDAPGDRLAVVRRHHRRPELVPAVPEVPLGRPDGIRRAVAAPLRRQRHDADNGDDRRVGPADADHADRGVLPRAEDGAEGRYADGPDAGRVPRLAPADPSAAAAALLDVVVREVPGRRRARVW